MYCSHCGNQLKDGSKFCNKCGGSLGNSQNHEPEGSKNLVDAEFKKGVYKLQNGDTVEAEKIFEDLAITHGVPMAWVYIGGIKLKQLELGKTNVQQALNCFIKASQLSPESKGQNQVIYCDVSLWQIKNFCGRYLEAKKQAGKAKGRAFGGLALGGLAMLLGNQSNKTTNKILGDAGAIYGGYRASKNFSQSKDAKQLLSFYNNTIAQLIEGVKIYCSDNNDVYQKFINGVNQFSLSDNALKGLQGMVNK